MEVASKATSNLPNGLKTTLPSSGVCYHRRIPTVPECLLHPRWGSLELFWGDCCRRRTPTVHECSYHPQSAHSPGPSLGVCFRMKTPTAHGCSWHQLWETAKLWTLHGMELASFIPTAESTVIIPPTRSQSPYLPNLGMPFGKSEIRVARTSQPAPNFLAWSQFTDQGNACNNNPHDAVG